MYDDGPVRPAPDARADTLRVSLAGLDNPWTAPDPREWVQLCEAVAAETDSYLEALNALPGAHGIGLWIRFRTASLSVLSALVTTGDDPELIARLDEAAQTIATATLPRSLRSSV